MTDADKQEINKLINNAIIKERARITHIINMSEGYFRRNGDNELVFDWDKTVREISNSILNDSIL